MIGRERGLQADPVTGLEAHQTKQQTERLQHVHISSREVNQASKCMHAVNILSRAAFKSKIIPSEASSHDRADANNRAKKQQSIP